MHLSVENYQKLSELTGRMRLAATEGQWDHLVELEQECKRQVEIIKPLDQQAVDEEARKQKIALIKKILADDAEIRNRTEVWMGQLQRIMQSTKSEARLQQAYNTSY